MYNLFVSGVSGSSILSAVFNGGCQFLVNPLGQCKREKRDWEKQKDLIKQKWLLVFGTAKKAYSDH